MAMSDSVKLVNMHNLNRRDLNKEYFEAMASVVIYAILGAFGGFLFGGIPGLITVLIIAAWFLLKTAVKYTQLIQMKKDLNDWNNKRIADYRKSQGLPPIPPMNF